MYWKTKLLEQSIHSDGIINLFTDFDKGFSLFDVNFLDKIEKMEQKNLSIELLNKLLNDEIRAISRHDLIKGKEFSERLRAIMKRYKDGLVGNAEGLDQFAGIGDLVKTETDEYAVDDLQKTRAALIALAKEAMESQDEHIRLGLSRAEVAFYHAISKPENIQDFYTNDELINLTSELTKALSDQMTADWTMRESGKANMRRTIKR